MYEELSMRHDDGDNVTSGDVRRSNYMYQMLFFIFSHLKFSFG